jgi:hypothetical protein
LGSKQQQRPSSTQTVRVKSPAAKENASAMSLALGAGVLRERPDQHQLVPVTGQGSGSLCGWPEAVGRECRPHPEPRGPHLSL